VLLRERCGVRLSIETVDLPTQQHPVTRADADCLDQPSGSTVF
jgi:hypothetical protein